MGTVLSLHHGWYAIKMVHDHLSREHFSAKQPKRKKLREYLSKSNGVSDIPCRTHKLSRGIVIVAIEFLCFTKILIGDRLTHACYLQFLDCSGYHCQHSLVLTDCRSALWISDYVELAHDELRPANADVAGIVSSKAVFRGFPHLFHGQLSTKPPTIQQCPHQPQGRGVVRFALDIGEIRFHQGVDGPIGSLILRPQTEDFLVQFAIVNPIQCVETVTKIHLPSRGIPDTRSAYRPKALRFGNPAKH